MIAPEERDGSDPDRKVRIAEGISDRTPIDWRAEAPSAREAEETSGLRDLERLAAAYAQVAKQFDATEPGPAGGTLVGRYRILERVGAGSMGAVYRAQDEHLKLGRTVALKLVHPERAGDDTAREILLREARIACRFTHPNIATLFEADEWEGRLFLAMEYVEGDTLLDLLRRRPLDVDDALDYGIQIASALQAAHEAGIVHRDLKSNNIVVTPAGRVKVLDFGIAVLTAPGGKESSPIDAYGPAGWVAGTLPYMAPECLRAEAPDPRCDIWALGITLYEALSGKRPFSADNRAALEHAIQEGRIPPLPASVPLQFRRVIERCLEKNPARRYQHAGEVRAALEAIRDGRKASRRPSYRWAIAITALLVVAVAGYKAWEEWWEHHQGGPSLIVLPAHNASGQASQQYLADGLTDEVISTFQGLSSIRALSRRTTNDIAHESGSLTELAKRHGIDLALESSVVQVGDRVRVNAALIRARKDKPLWSRAYERPVREALTLDRDIVRGVADHLKLKLTAGEIASLRRAPPIDPVAYKQYVLGRNFAAERNYRRALASYAEAIRLDSTFAAAWAGTAQCSIEMLYYGDTSPEVTPERAGASALRALEIDSTQAAAHIALAYLLGFQWNWRGARAQLELAQADEPGSPELWYAWSMYYGVLGQSDEEVDAMQRALGGDPTSLRYKNELGLAYLNDRNLGDAESQFREVEEGGVSDESPHARAYRARCLVLRGKVEEGLGVLRDLEREGAPVFAREEMTYALARAGRVSEARRRIAALSGSNGAVSPLAIAAAQFAVGDPDAAFATLGRACDQKDSRILWIRVDQRFDPIRKDPRYAALLARIPPAPA